MQGIKTVQIPVYLASRVIRDGAGSEIRLSERRLLRQSDQDRVIAVIEAPRGTRIRRRPDRHGQDQLLVPRDGSLLSRLLGRWVVIPAKYVLSDARSGCYGLSTPPRSARSTADPEAKSVEPEPEMELVG